jgi:hypothetical protein
MVQVQGCLIDRPYVLFSTEYEQIEFYLLERKPTTVDLRENWPIFDVDRTLELSLRFGVKQPYRGRFPDPFTIDFIVTELVDGKPQDCALSVKTPKDAADPDVRQREKVPFVWCQEYAEIPWRLVDTKGFSRRLLSTLLFMRAWFGLGYEPDSTREALFVQHFLATYARNVPLKTLIRRSADALHLSEDLATDTFRYCAWTDCIPVSLKHTLELDWPLVLRNRDEHD